MAFGTTITITVNAVAKILSKINQDSYGSEYLLRNPTDEFRLKIRHLKESGKKTAEILRGMDRHNIEFTQTIYATSTTPEIVRQVYAVIRVSPGDDPTAQQLFIDGFAEYFAGTVPQNDLINWLS